MAKIKTLLKIDGKNYTHAILTPFKVGRHKIWGEDSGRVLSGKMVGSLVGIFPKLTVIFYPKDEDEMAELLEKLDNESQELEYYNARFKGMTFMGTYTGDYEYEIINLEPTYGAITVSFIAVEKE